MPHPDISSPMNDLYGPYYEECSPFWYRIPPIRHCNDVDGYPSSLARPSLWQTPMFTDQAGNEAFNNQDMELPIVKVPHPEEAQRMLII
jgi:hypothetical protein